MELVFTGLALALFGLWPRRFGLTWAGYAVATFIAFLGPGLKLAPWVLDLAPPHMSATRHWKQSMPATWPR